MDSNTVRLQGESLFAAIRRIAFRKWSKLRITYPPCDFYGATVNANIIK